WIEPLIDEQRRVGDPLRRLDRRRGPPEFEQRELTQPLLQLFAQIGWLRPYIRDFSAIDWIHRPRRDGVIAARIHRVPPADVGAGEVRIKLLGGFPDPRALPELVRLPPELDLAFVAEIPAVSDDPVLARPSAREIGRLHRTRNRRNHWLDR